MSIKERLPAGQADFKRLVSLCKGGPPPNRRKPPVPLVVEYHGHWLLPPLAMLVGTLMVVYGHHIPFGVFILKADFYKAAIPSIFAAWAVMRLILRNTRQLDASCPWWPSWWPAPLHRLLLQTYHGLAKPGFFIFGIFSLYFLIRQRPGLIPRYLSEDFPLVLLLLTGFNLLCWVYYRMRMAELQRQWKDWAYRLRKSPLPEVAMELLPGVEVVPYAERVRDTAALYEPSGQGNNTSLVTKLDGAHDMEPQSLKDIYAQLEGEHFYMIRRETIVNRRAIREVRETENALFVVLYDREVSVSHRRRKGFLAWWKED